ncbi:MAG: hypothetical protein PHE33_09475 [Bacteroidales bacterium]|nr:hypothetical protein [Bacteroidales bacterium]
MKYLLFTLVILSFMSCNKLKDFVVSDCISRNCPYGLSSISYDEKGNLTIDYGTGDLCLTKYWGAVELRNDSLILITRKNSTGAHCTCGYILTYTIRGIDTCDLKIGFEKDYANFVKRAQKKAEKLKAERNITVKEQSKYDKKMNLLYSRGFSKNWKIRREIRNELKDDYKTRRRKDTRKLKTPFDDVYQ